MNQQFTEKNFPIQAIWVIESSFVLALFFTLAIIFIDAKRHSAPGESIWYFPLNINLIILIYFGSLILSLIVIFLRRATFKYSLDSEYITVHQGVISKKETHIPYGRVQDVFLSQGIFDRIFGLGDVLVENVAIGAVQTINQNKKRRGASFSLMGVNGNKFSIPGIKIADAQKFREVILQKMKENPSETTSGL